MHRRPPSWSVASYKKFWESLPCPALSFIESLEVSISDPTIRQSSYLAITATACRQRVQSAVSHGFFCSCFTFLPTQLWNHLFAGYLYDLHLILPFCRKPRFWHVLDCSFTYLWPWHWHSRKIVPLGKQAPAFLPVHRRQCCDSSWRTYMSIVTYRSVVMGIYISFNIGHEISQQSCGHDYCYFCPVDDKAKVPKVMPFPRTHYLYVTELGSNSREFRLLTFTSQF